MRIRFSFEIRIERSPRPEPVEDMFDGSPTSGAADTVIAPRPNYTGFTPNMPEEE